MILAKESFVSVYLDAMAALLIFGILLLPDRTRIKSETEGKLFYALCTNTLVMAICSGVCYALHFQTFQWAYHIELFSKTVLELALLHLVYQWLIYVDFKLYASRDQLVRRYKAFFIPIAVFAALLVINMFTSILFTIMPDMKYTSTILYDVMMGIEYLYMAVSVALIYQYDKRHKGRRVFDIVPAVVPMILGSLVNIFTEYSGTALGIAVGLVLLYFSMMNGWRFEDTGSGYYNRAFIKEILEGDSFDADSIQGVISFEAPGGGKELGKILHNELAGDGIIIHESEDRYLLLTENGNIGDLYFLADMVEDAIQDDENSSVALTTKCGIRKGGEDAKTFLERIAISSGN